jgi:hypothetical protein
VSFFAELERAMLEHGWTWNGDGPDDAEGRFVREGYMPMTRGAAEDWISGRRGRMDEALDQ